jgi:hypothetical protein
MREMKIWKIAKKLTGGSSCLTFHKKFLIESKSLFFSEWLSQGFHFFVS